MSMEEIEATINKRRVQSIRLECVRLAVEVQKGLGIKSTTKDTLESAKLIVDFVQGD